MDIDLKLLDCTLRDGGYINDWKWDFQRARNIILMLVKAGIDIVEVGFLRNVEKYDENITVCNRIEELNRLLPKEKSKTKFAAMFMCSNYDIDKLSEYNGHGIEMLRITAHDYDIDKGLEYARKAMQKNYKVSINPINIMGYTDRQILDIIDNVNKIHPYQFAIVDTFGSMKKKDLSRIVSLVDHNLEPDIRLALHLHENMSMSFCLAQEFVDYHLNRPISIDASLMGIGRIPGNLPMELISDNLNDYYDKNYVIDYMMDAIQDYISPLKKENAWGYTPAYFLAARYNLHRNYAEHYLSKGDLTHRDINYILSKFSDSKKTVFDASYADMVYEQYKNNSVDDSEDRSRLQGRLADREILIIAPGKTIIDYRSDIKNYIDAKNPVVISVNFVPDDYSADYIFLSNNRRLEILDKIDCETILTSNIPDVSKNECDYQIDYNSLCSSFEFGCNGLIMLLKLLEDFNISKVAIAGADGYLENDDNYYNSSIRNYSVHGEKFNHSVSKAINSMTIGIRFLTPTQYSIDKGVIDE